MHIGSRIAGAIIGGGGTYGVALVLAPDLGQPVVLGIASVMAVLGAVFGPKIWEAVLHLF